MSLSSVEEMRDSIITQVKTITVANGYRSDVGDNVLDYFAELRTISYLPTVSVLLGNESVKSMDAYCTVWKSKVDVTLVGYVKVDNCELLLHDLKRLLAATVISHSNEADNRWVISMTEQGDGMARVGRYFLAGEKSGFCSITVTVIVINQDQTFSPLIEEA